MITTDVLIIGAGMAGLMAAQVLETVGISVTILDKEQVVGGRLATHQIGAGLADIGAQFFTVRSDDLQVYVDSWLEKGWLFEWSRGWSDGSLKRTPLEGSPHYAVKGGMRQLAEHLAGSLADIRLDIRVTSIKPKDDGWVTLDAAGQVHGSRAIILTPPVPQSLDLLEQSNITLTNQDQHDLQQIKYGPCLCGIFHIEGAVDLPEPGAVQTLTDKINWIADNHRKGISDTRVLTIHTSPRYSRAHWDEPDSIIVARLQEDLETRLGASIKLIEGQIKRWQYSIPLTTHPHATLLAEGLPPLAFAGDAFGGRGRVEGAALSGLAAAQALLTLLQSTE